MKIDVRKTMALLLYECMPGGCIQIQAWVAAVAVSFLCHQRHTQMRFDEGLRICPMSQV